MHVEANAILGKKWKNLPRLNKSKISTWFSCHGGASVYHSPPVRTIEFRIQLKTVSNTGDVNVHQNPATASPAGRKHTGTQSRNQPFPPSGVGGAFKRFYF